MPIVLVVEDDPSSQKLCGHLLKRSSNCDVYFADNLESAKILLDSGIIFDAVTLDGQLRGADHGRQVAAYIVGTVWPRQNTAGIERTPFATLSGTIYEVEGTSAVYCKSRFPSVILTSGVASWLDAMKAARPAMPVHPSSSKAVVVEARSTTSAAPSSLKIA